MATLPRPASRMRRYPALLFLALAAILATLLPSALRVPLTGPSATAEIAPVPGKSNDANGNLSALDATSTQGLGYGLGSGGIGGAGGGGAGGRLPAAPSQGANPVQKRCVGKPPYTRQTEDPLSPPCVAYFKGDNFGSTWEGVTRDQVNVIVWADCGADGSVSLVDLNVPQYDGYHYSEYIHYFNERFQTYGRTVHVWVTVQPRGQKAGDCHGNTPTTRAAVQSAHDVAHPFFITSWTQNSLPQAASEEASRLHIMSQAEVPARDFTAANSPYVISWEPDVSNLADHVVGLVCSSLAGRQVTFGDPGDAAKKRKFGVVYDQESDASNEGLDLVRNGIHDRCGDQAGTVEATPPGRMPTPADMDRLHAAGVTTVLWLATGPPLGLNGTGSRDPSTAGTNSWHPEAILTDSEFVGRNDLSRAFGSALNTSAGLMLDRRRGPYGDQPERIALRDVCSDCQPNSIDIGIYDRLFMLFTGIQAAGPRLTPQSFDKGMRALPPHNQGDPYVPAAYFGPGDHSFIKDYPLVWWDSSGKVADAPEPGCWRLVEDGKRYRAEDWAGRQGADTGIFQRVPAQPCQDEE
jgi:hypothetical protein